MKNQYNEGVETIIRYLEETIEYVKKIHSQDDIILPKEHSRIITNFLIVTQALLSTFVSMSGKSLPEKIQSIKVMFEALLSSCVVSIQELELRLVELQQWGDLTNKYPSGHA
jgi:hypothetical protein